MPTDPRRVALLRMVPVVAMAAGCGAGHGRAAPPVGLPDAGAEVPAGLDPTHRLSARGVYRDLAAREPAEGLVAYAPRHSLWADGAQKRRWVQLPAGSRIDTSDQAHWRFPAGTRFIKDFERDGLVCETRVIEIHEGGAADFASYVWLADGSDALLAPSGAKDIRGTQHDAPSQKECARCHQGEPGWILGFSAIQLAGSEPAPSLRSLAAEGRLSHAPAVDVGVPGDGVAAAALGSLHANCGHCHAEGAFAWEGGTHLVLRIAPGETRVEETRLYASNVGIALEVYRQDDLGLRIAPGRSTESALVARMRLRDHVRQMPPLATELVDDAGIAAVAAWIDALPPRVGERSGNTRSAGNPVSHTIPAQTGASGADRPLH